MKEYKIIDGCQPNDVAARVNQAIKDGWECLGGLEVAYAAGDYFRAIFAQAMIRETKKGNK